MKQKGIFYLIYAVMISMVITACGGGGGDDGTSQSVSDTSRKGSLQLVLKDETNASQFETVSVESAQRTSRAFGFESQSSGVNSFSSQSAVESSSLSPGSVTTNEPALDLNLDTFRIKGEGPAGESFNTVVRGRGARQIEGLVAGNWTITVIAQDVNGLEFARGSQAVTVRPSEVTPSFIEVVMAQGKGSFDFAIEW